MTLADFQQLVDDLVRDTDQVITTTQRDRAIAGALVRYSADAPLRRLEDVVVGAQGRLTLPAAWVSGFSRVLAVHYPLGPLPLPPLPAELVVQQPTPTGDEVVLLADIAPGETVRLTYTGQHELADVPVPVDTLPVAHVRAVAALAASDLCGQLAAYYSNESSPVMAADTVDHQGKSGRWRTRARDLAAEYGRVVGAAPVERSRPASADAQLPGRNSLGGGRLFHPPSDWPRA